MNEIHQLVNNPNFSTLVYLEIGNYKSMESRLIEGTLFAPFNLVLFSLLEQEKEEAEVNTKK